MDIMPINGIEDYEMRIKRQDAFWDNEIIDRPCAYISFDRQEGRVDLPESKHATLKERWMDVEYQTQLAAAQVQNTVFMGEALPIAMPNLGPDFFPALYGGEFVFEEDTSYIKPFLDDWEDAASLKLNKEHPYWLKQEELYDSFLEAGKNEFYVGWPDIHGGGDCLVGWRGPQNMAFDLFDEPEAIEEALQGVLADFLETVNYYSERLRAAGQPGTGWPEIVSSKKWHVPSNDFSYMISPDQFDEFFLEGLRKESEFFEASLHHLDGPGCLNHLDSLLTIEKMNAVQWVWGAGNGDLTDWFDVFKRVQAKGKGLQLLKVDPKDLDTIMEELSPEGIWMRMININNEDEAEAVLNKISTWKS